MNKKIIICGCGKDLTELNDYNRGLYKKACETKSKQKSNLQSIKKYFGNLSK